MNEHLEPIFKILLPELERAGIDYWVYGGVSVAAYAGKFIRLNKDVDIFVKNNDFGKVKLILEDLCNKNNFALFNHLPPKNSFRPKLDIKIENEERLSVIPVYLKDDKVEFKYKDGNQLYSNKILNKIERNISGFRFFTPPNEYIKKLFSNHIIARSDKKSRLKIKKDAKAIFSLEELAKLDWRIDQ